MDPVKPYSGTLYIRTSPDVHREAAITAAQQGKGLMHSSVRLSHRQYSLRISAAHTGSGGGCVRRARAGPEPMTGCGENPPATHTHGCAPVPSRRAR
ncbi:MAG: type II toxin-antitoxin system HicB family antitoxin [Actinobacteria bacterium]|nr:type II toxin-antitoxin system HicB family antitoxin [Actinomycetota bacterium]